MTKWKSNYNIKVYQEQFLDNFTYSEIEDMALGLNTLKYIDELPGKLFRDGSKEKTAHYYEQFVIESLIRDAEINGTMFSDELKCMIEFYIMAYDVTETDNMIQNVDDYHSAIIRYVIDVISNEILDLISWGKLEVEKEVS